MGESYLTFALKDSLNNEFNNLHATFGRPVAIFKTAKEIVVSTSNNHNFLFQGSPNNDIVQETVQSGVFLARVLYGKKQTRPNVGGAATQQPMIELEEGEVRLKLDPTGAAFLNGAERATVDGNILKVMTSPRPHGLFDPNFYTFYFKKLD
jgi:hypothetical protein